MGEPTVWTGPIPRSSETRAASRSRALADGSLVHAIFLASLILPFILLPPTWIVSKFRDPWIYFGYYLNLTGHLAQFPDLYFGSRLSFLLPGYALHRFLPPVTANHVLHLCSYGVSVVSMYLIVRWTVAPRAGLLAAIALGTYSHFVDAAGRDYADGFGIMYFLLGLAAVTRAALYGREVAMLILAGAAMSGLVVANLFYVVLTPLFVCQWFVLRPYETPARQAAAIFWILVGSACALGALGFMNQALGGSFWFLEPSVRFLHGYYGQGTGGDRRLLAILPFVGCLSLQAIAVISLPVALKSQLSTLGKRATLRATPYPWYLLYIFIVFYVYHSFRGIVLSHSYYTSLLIPVSILSMAPFLERVSVSLKEEQFILITSTGLVAGILSCFAPDLGTIVSYLYNTFSLGSFLLASPAILASAISLLRSKPAPLCACGFLLGLAAAGYLSRPIVESEVEYARPDLAEQARVFNEHRIDVLHVLSSGMRFVQRADEGKGAFLWYRLEGPDGLIFDNLAAAFPWGHRIFNRDFPLAEKSYSLFGQAFSPGTVLVVATTEQTLGDTPFLALWKVGIKARQVARHRIAHGQIAFFLHVLRIDSILDATAARGKVQRNG